MEPENRSQTESPADHSHLDDSARTLTTAERDNPSETPTVVNADNERFQPFEEDGKLTGHIDEVNGLGAAEVPFTPTRHELLLLVKHYALLAHTSAFRKFGLNDYRFFWPEHWPVCFGDRRLIRAENLLGAEVVRQAIEEVERDFRHSAQLTLRDWDIYRHGTYDETRELHQKLWDRRKTWTQEELQMEALQKELEASRQQVEMEEWREQHQAARDAARKKFLAEEFLRDVVTNAKQAAEEPDERARELQIATLAAKILTRLATSELFENDTQQQAALLAVRLVDCHQMEVQ